MTFKITTTRPGASAARIFSSQNRYAPRIVFDVENEQGNDAEAVAAAAAAAEAAALEAAAKAAELDGKPTDAEAKLLKDVMGKKKALDDLKVKSAATEAQLKAFADLGISPEDIQKMISDKVNAEKAEAERKGDFERVKTMMADEHKRSEAARVAEIEALRASNGSKDAVIDELTVGTTFSNSKFIADKLVLSPSKARALFGANFDIVESKVVAFDKPRGAAGRTMLVDAAGEALGFEAAIEKIIAADADHDTLVRSKLVPGAKSKTIDVKKVDGDNADDGLSGISRIAAALTEKRAAATLKK